MSLRETVIIAVQKKVEPLQFVNAIWEGGSAEMTNIPTWFWKLADELRQTYS